MSWPLLISPAADGRKATLVTGPTWLENVRRTTPRFGSLTWMPPPAAPLASDCPRGEKARQSTPAWCPPSVARGSRVTAFHRRTDLSSPAEAIVTPSGEAATARTGPACPDSTPAFVRFSTSHMRTLASSPPE